MNETDVILEYARRYQFSKYCQYIAVPFFAVSLSGLWISRGAFFSPGEKAFFLAAALLLIASLALAVLSIYRYRCPNCNKILGVARKIKFCPDCGVNLQPAPSGVGNSSRTPGERRGILGRVGMNFIPSGGISRTAASGISSQGNVRPAASDFPEETYPKNIRMFTTSDERELTRRYFHLIAKDDAVQMEEIPAGVPDDSSEIGWRLGNIAPENAPRWRSKEKKKLS
jgi:hypothetical protein